MAFRKEAFQAKVLQRLYPAASPKAEKVRDSSDHNLEPDYTPQTTKPNQNKSAGGVGTCGLSVKKLYTVLPPPADYRLSRGDGEEELQEISSADRTLIDLSGSSNSDSAEDQNPVRRRRKRRRKRKIDDAGASRTCSPPLRNKGAEEQEEKAEEQEEKAEEQEEKAEEQEEKTEERNGKTLEVPEVQEILSKSRKRKLKKKRQKEKLRLLGQVTKSRPLEFTYRQDEENEEEEESEEENSQKVEEVVDFLRTTWNIYLSDRSRTAESPSLSQITAETLLTCLSAGTAPPGALSSLCRLRTLLGRREVEKLKTELQEFSHTSTLSTDETLLVHTLFNYWITEVLPMQSQTAT